MGVEWICEGREGPPFYLLDSTSPLPMNLPPLLLKADFAAKERELFEPRAVPAWFTSDSRLGQISIWLEPPSCFLAGERAPPLDLLVNVLLDPP